MLRTCGILGESRSRATNADAAKLLRSEAVLRIAVGARGANAWVLQPARRRRESKQSADEGKHDSDYIGHSIHLPFLVF